MHSKSYTPHHGSPARRGFNPPSFAVRFMNSKWERLPDSLANFPQTEMTNAANFFAAFEACLPAAYEVSCRIRTGSPTSFWLDSPRTVASRRSIGSPVPRRRGLGRQAATRRRHRGVYEFARGCQSSGSVCGGGVLGVGD